MFSGFNANTLRDRLKAGTREAMSRGGAREVMSRGGGRGEKGRYKQGCEEEERREVMSRGGGRGEKGRYKQGCEEEERREVMSRGGGRREKLRTGAGGGGGTVERREVYCHTVDSLQYRKDELWSSVSHSRSVEIFTSIKTESILW